mgnify:CR=1 FL=1
MCKEYDKIKAESEKLQAKVKLLGHVPKHIGNGMCDDYTCSCGWKSNGYWDGAEWAWAEWEKHAKQILKVEVKPD